MITKETPLNATVSALHIYPLKSARGLSLKKMDIVNSGPKFDREWMLINDSNHFITQRVKPEMCHIATQLTSEHLILSAPKQEDLYVALDLHQGETLDVKIFSDWTQAIHLKKEYDQWFSDFLNAKVKLIRSPQRKSRETSGKRGPKTEIKFPDGYPFLLTNEATLKELNEKLDQPVSMLRFRPNIIISGPPANKEEEWTKFTIGNVNFLSVKSCTRCSIINISPSTGKKSSRVTQTLKSYRTKEGTVIFGNNLSHTSTGHLKVGDTLQNIQ